MNLNPGHTYKAPSDIDPYVKELIKHKVRRLIASGAISRQDSEDLAQELALHAHAAGPRHNPRLGARSTFFEVVLTRKLATLMRARRAQKRDRRRVRPIDDVAEEALAYEPCRQLDRAMDVRDAMGALPSDLLSIAELLCEMRQADVIRQTGLTRQRVRGRQRRIAQHLRCRELP